MVNGGSRAQPVAEEYDGRRGKKCVRQRVKEAWDLGVYMVST